ncbi:hypothetical protein L1887_02768 [Cichorium endivia]|nr:hypothetical protein L1887_02768 [Cichorium endivia]
MESLFFLLFYLVITTNASPIASPIVSPHESPIQIASPTESPIPIVSPAESPIPETSNKLCWLGWWKVHIYDAMKDPITIHVQSKEDDLGNRTIAFNGSTSWKFCLSSYGRTRFYAHFYWKSRTAFFDVYDYDTASTYCASSNTFKQQNCFWLVRDDGFYISRHYNPFPGGWTKLHDWS